MLAVAIIFACLLKEPDDVEEEDEEVEYVRNLFMSDYSKRLQSLHNKELNIHKSLMEAMVNLKDTCVAFDPSIDMTSEAALAVDGLTDSEKAMAKRKEHQKMFYFFVQFIFRIIYIICLVVVANGSTSHYSNLMYNDISATYAPDDTLLYVCGIQYYVDIHLHKFNVLCILRCCGHFIGKWSESILVVDRKYVPPKSVWKCLVQ